MLKGNRKYYLVFALIFIALAAYQYLSPKAINWSRTYLSAHKIPYGTNAIYQLLESRLISEEVKNQDQSIYSALNLKEKTGPPTTYLFIDAHIKFDRLDTRELMKFVSAGNTAFICAADISGPLADTFSITTDVNLGSYFEFNKDSVKQGKAETFLYFSNPKLSAKMPYAYNGMLQNNYFSSFDTARALVLSTDQKQKTDLLSIAHGKGKFIFSTLPDVFTNYFIVNEPNRDYSYKALSYAANPVLWWDEHYKSGRQKSDSPLGYVLANDSLYAAWILALLSLLFFMAFETKRRQRMIPVIVPLKNTTLEFVEVVGSVYYSAKNHKMIAEEKINVFLEFIRSRFQVSTRLFDESFYKRVSVLSGISREELALLFETVDRVNFKHSITEQELTELNSLIDNFYKNNKR
ncbi:MAG: DUF4350 domain-containing protein [Bacteroidia bacterium]